MPARFAILSYLLMFGIAFSAGCQSNAPRKPYPNDPLLISKKPLEGMTSTPPAALIVRSEPVPPQHPAAAVANLSPPRGSNPPRNTAEARQRSVTAQPAVTRKAPLIAQPAVRIREAEAEAFAGAVPHPIQGIYGHAPDYAWLQGVLDKHYDGHFDLRYCDPAVEDKWGGKVCLEHDPRLNEFRDGDIVQLEGEIIRPSKQEPTWGNYPRYRIRTIWLVQPKK